MSESSAPRLAETLFVNEMRLGAAHWALAVGVVILAAVVTPRVWKRAERVDAGPDYRIPYALSRDYWFFGRRLGDLGDPRRVAVLGDSVVWGEYVLPDGTLTHFLNGAAEGRERYVNCGADGLHPLALEGLIRYYGGALRGRKVLLHCNLLWLSSAKADLEDPGEENLDHPHLLPQFFPRVPAYGADAAERIGAVVGRNVGFLSWVEHMQIAHFDGLDLPDWTLATDGGDPPRRPNAYRNPLGRITLDVPGDTPNDPKRGPRSRRHRPWTATSEGPTAFAWVGLDHSLQWAAFQRLLLLLRERGDDVLVFVGPFNEHMLTAENAAAYRRVRDGVAAWLTEQRFPHIEPEPLPSALYADASHPLTEGYRLLAERLYRSGALNGRRRDPGQPASGSR